MSGEDTTTGRTLSRIGRQPIPIPQGVEVEVLHNGVTVKGPKGTLTQTYHPQVKVIVDQGQILVERLSERKFHHSLHGLTRSLIANAIIGVTEGYTKTLELMGVGYRVQQTDDGITLTVGYSHLVEIKPIEAEKLIYNETISEGMIPKIRTCINAVNNGVRGVVVIDGRKPHSILFELFSDKGSGTLIRK